MATSDAIDERMWSGEICRAESISGRCLTTWIATGRFPRPDGNLNGRNFWMKSTHTRWRQEVLAGRYQQARG